MAETDGRSLWGSIIDVSPSPPKGLRGDPFGIIRANPQFFQGPHAQLRDGLRISVCLTAETQKTALPQPIPLVPVALRLAVPTRPQIHRQGVAVGKKREIDAITTLTEFS